jgi:hypothetical protein
MPMIALPTVRWKNPTHINGVPMLASRFAVIACYPARSLNMRT